MIILKYFEIPLSGISISVVQEVAGYQTNKQTNQEQQQQQKGGSYCFRVLLQNDA